MSMEGEEIKVHFSASMSQFPFHSPVGNNNCGTAQHPEILIVQVVSVSRPGKTYRQVMELYTLMD